MRRTIAAALVAVFACAVVVAAPSDQDRLVQLDSRLDAVETEARSRRRIAGGILVGSGALTGAAFGVAAVSVQSVWPEAVLPVLISGGLFAAASIVPGTIFLSNKSDYEVLSERFDAMGEASPEERRRKLGMGETYLDSLAAKGRHGRLVGGVLILLMGVANLYTGGVLDGILPSNLRSAPDGYAEDGSPSPVQGVLLIGLSTPAFIMRSRPEREMDAYREWAAASGRD